MAAFSITGQSLSLPMTMPTTGLSLIDGSCDVVGGMCRAGPRVGQRPGGHVDVADLAAGPDRLAVEVDLDPRVAGQYMAVGAAELVVPPTQDVGHHGPRRPGRRVAERKVEHRPKVL